MYHAASEKYGTLLNMPSEIKEEFLAGSRPLMKYTNLLTFNMRAIALYIAALINMPWLYLIFEITVMNMMLVYMHHEHEALCKRITSKILAA